MEKILVLFFFWFLTINAFAQKADSVLIKNHTLVNLILQKCDSSNGLSLLILDETSVLVLDGIHNYRLFYQTKPIVGIPNDIQYQFTEFQLEALNVFLNAKVEKVFYKNTCPEKYIDYQTGNGLVLLNKTEKYFFLLRGCPARINEIVKENKDVESYFKLMMNF